MGKLGHLIVEHKRDYSDIGPPWSLDPSRVDWVLAKVFPSPYYKESIEHKEYEEWAELFVRAVNNHDALLDACKTACVAMCLRVGHDGKIKDGYEYCFSQYGGAMADAYQKLRLAIADMEKADG